MSMYKKGDIIKVKITGIENYGIFIETKENYDGLIHISEISNSFVKNIKDYVNLNEIISAKIIEVDEEHKRLKLSIKDINYNEDDKLFHLKNNGFKNLKEHLKPWMDEKIAEINKK